MSESSSGVRRYGVRHNGHKYWWTSPPATLVAMSANFSSVCMQTWCRRWPHDSRERGRTWGLAGLEAMECKECGDGVELEHGGVVDCLYPGMRGPKHTEQSQEKCSLALLRIFSHATPLLVAELSWKSYNAMASLMAEIPSSASARTQAAWLILVSHDCTIISVMELSFFSKCLVLSVGWVGGTCSLYALYQHLTMCPRQHACILQ